MTQLFAQPYNVDASGFYFENTDSFASQAAINKSRYGEPVEEYEIEFIDGERIDCEFATSFELDQVNLSKFFELVDQWDEGQKTRFIIAVGECGVSFDIERDEIDGLEIEVYAMNSLKELAEELVDEGLFGEVPESLRFYIDYEAIASDLGVEYTNTDIAGSTYIYRLG